MPATIGEEMLVPPTVSVVYLAGLPFGKLRMPTAKPVISSPSALMSGAERTRPPRLPGAVASAVGTLPFW